MKGFFMKHSLLTIASILLSVFCNDIVFASQRQLSLLSAPKDMRIHIYSLFTVQELARVACTNQSLSKEIGNIGLYRGTNFEDLKKEIQSAWCCYREAGCYPKIKLCFFDVLCFENTFHVRQEQLIPHWIKNVVRPGIWQEKDRLIGKDEGGHSFSPVGNNYIILKPSNGDRNAICIDNIGTEQKGGFNPIITVYSIGSHGSLSQDEFDVFVNNNITNPLVIVLDKILIANNTMMNSLLEKFKSLSDKEIGAEECLQKLNEQLKIYYSLRDAKQEVLEVCQNAQYMQLKPQSDELLKNVEQAIAAKNTENHDSVSKIENASVIPVPKNRPCSIQ